MKHQANPIILRRKLGSRSELSRTAERAHEFGALTSQLIRENPHIDITTIRLSEFTDGIVQVAGSNTNH